MNKKFSKSIDEKIESNICDMNFNRIDHYVTKGYPKPKYYGKKRGEILLTPEEAIKKYIKGHKN